MSSLMCVSFRFSHIIITHKRIYTAEVVTEKERFHLKVDSHSKKKSDNACVNKKENMDYGAENDESGSTCSLQLR